MLALIDYIAAILVRILNAFFYFLPIRFILWLGRQCGSIACLINTERRVIGYSNLRAAFCKEKSPRELKKIVKKVYKNLAEVVFEILSLTKVDEKYVDKYIEIVNPEAMLKVYNHHDGTIFLTAHFGNWELSGVTSSIKGFPIVALAREQSMKRVNALLDRLRESKGLEIVRKGITTKYIVRALHEGKMIGMVGDQNAGEGGVFVDFFGRPASTAPGTARFAQKTGAFILPAFMARQKGPYHKLILEEPIRIKEGEDLTPHLQEYNKILEKRVTMYPEQWLWLHRRWKSSPLKKVTIISDGKAGHLNQSKAVYKLLKKYREDSGYKNEDTQIEIIEVKFKNNLFKTLLNACAVFSSRNCQGCMRCLKFCLARDCYEKLMSRYSDIVLSCGSSVAGVNRLFSIENNAKSVAIMKPSILGLNKFDMVILPRHDRVRSTPNGSIVVTDTVPNLIDEGYLRDAKEQISKIAKLKDKPRRIGVLLGGDNKGFVLTDDITEKLLEGVIDASKRLDAEVLFTTSRRTPKSAEYIVKAKLRPEERCKFLVIANEKNIPHAVGGILGLSDVVIVSGESASMISEAVQSGKRVLVFKLKEKKRKNASRMRFLLMKFFGIPPNAGKFERMLRNLEKKGYIITRDVETLSDAICKDFHEPELRPFSQDSFDIYKYMWRLGV